MFYKALVDKMLRYASIVTMPTREPETGIIGERQIARGEQDSMLSCIADRQLSTRLSKQENGRIS